MSTLLDSIKTAVTIDNEIPTDVAEYTNREFALAAMSCEATHGVLIRLETTMLNTILKRGIEFANACDLRAVKPAERKKWLQGKLNGWLIETFTPYYDMLTFPAKGERMVKGNIYNLKPCVGDDPYGSVSFGETTKGYVSKICGIFQISGKVKLSKCTNSGQVERAYLDAKKAQAVPTNRDAIMELYSEILKDVDGKLPAKALIGIRNAMLEAAKMVKAA
jgi:hypothetical protein